MKDFDNIAIASIAMIKMVFDSKSQNIVSTTYNVTTLSPSLVDLMTNLSREEGNDMQIQVIQWFD